MCYRVCVSNRKGTQSYNKNVYKYKFANAMNPRLPTLAPWQINSALQNIETNSQCSQVVYKFDFLVYVPRFADSYSDENCTFKLI